MTRFPSPWPEALSSCPLHVFSLPLPLAQDFMEVPSPMVKGRGFPIFGNQRPLGVPLGLSCLLLGSWVTVSPLCPHKDSSLSPGGGRHTPQLACTHCPTCLSHTAYTGHASCRGSAAEGETGTGDSWPAERGQAKGSRKAIGTQENSGTLWKQGPHLQAHYMGTAQCHESPLAAKRGP